MKRSAWSLHQSSDSVLEKTLSHTLSTIHESPISPLPPSLPWNLSELSFRSYLLLHDNEFQIYSDAGEPPLHGNTGHQVLGHIYNPSSRRWYIFSLLLFVGPYSLFGRKLKSSLNCAQKLIFR